MEGLQPEVSGHGNDSPSSQELSQRGLGVMADPEEPVDANKSPSNLALLEAEKDALDDSVAQNGDRNAVDIGSSNNGDGQPAGPSPPKNDKPIRSRYKQRMREWKKKKGDLHSSDEEDWDNERVPGAVVLHKMELRRVVLLPEGIVVKSGRLIKLGEADALRIAEAGGIPVPHCHGTEKSPDGRRHIKMSHVLGQPLNELWKDMSVHEKESIARQLREIIVKMRSITPPPDLVAACDGQEIRDTRSYFTHTAPPARDEAGFNDYLIDSISKFAPRLLVQGMRERLSTDHRIVLTHCDLAPRNIMVLNGKVQALIDWEDAGWYPEYWDYVKFYQRANGEDGDWRDYVDMIFPCSYRDNVLDYYAMSMWQSP